MKLHNHLEDKMFDKYNQDRFKNDPKLKLEYEQYMNSGKKYISKAVISNNVQKV